MEGLRKRKWVSLTLLSIVVPMSLLATFRLTGILQGPITISETITLEAVKWDFQRPSQTVTLDDELESSYISDEISAIMRVLMGKYSDDDPAFASDFVTIGVTTNLTVTNLNSFVESVYVVIRKDRQSTVDWTETELYFENLSLVERVEGYRWITQTYIRFSDLNHSNSVYLSAAFFWSLLTPNDQTHELEVSYELTYYNGTAYKKIVQPFQLEIIGR